MIDIENLGAAVIVVALRDDGTVVYEEMNAAAERITGWSRTDLIGRSPGDLFAADVAETLIATYRECALRRETMEFERLVPLPRGTIATRTTLTPLFDPDKTVRRLLGVIVDTTVQNRLREDLKRSNARLAIAVDAFGGAPWYYDAKQREFELSTAFDRILGSPAPAERHMGMDEWLGRVHPDDRNDTCFADILAGRQEQGTAEFRVIADNGDVRWLRCRRRAVAEQGAVAGIAGIVVDITQDKRREAVLSQQAASDPLTGLANRRHFDDVIVRERERATRQASPLSLLMIDVDHFKRYNDTYGHVAGDAVLKRLAASFAAAVGAAGGTAARYGGEEFVAVLPGTDTMAAASVAEAIMAAVAGLGEPHAGSPTGQLSVSIGVAGQPGRPWAGPDLVALADAALYRAKNAGRGCYRIAEAPLRPKVRSERQPTAA